MTNLADIDAILSADDPEQLQIVCGTLETIGTADAINRLIQLLRHAHAGVRRAAHLSLTILGSPQLGAQLGPLLQDTDPNIRQEAFTLLIDLGEDSLEELHRLLQDSTTRLRQRVVEILGNIGSMESVDSLLPLLEDPDPALKSATISALASIGDPRAFKPLVSLLDDEEWLRFSIIEALGRLPHPQALEVLLRELTTHRDDHLTIRAICATLSELDDSSALAPLARLIEDMPEQGALSLALTMASITQSPEQIPPEARDLVRALLGKALPDLDAPQRKMALTFIARTNDPAATPDLLRLAQRLDPDTTPDTWQMVCTALVAAGNSTPLMNLLDGDDKSLKLACETLSAMGDTTVIPDLRRALTATTGDRRRLLALACARLASANDRELLEKLIHEQDGHIVAAAIEALTRIGDARDIAALQPLLDHPYPDVRHKALEAIVSLGTARAEETFLDLTRDHDPARRMLGLTGLQLTHSPRLPLTAQLFLRDPAWQVRAAACELILHGMLPLDEDDLLALLNDEHRTVSNLAIDIVGQRRLNAYRPFLMEAIRSTAPWTAFHAVEALGSFHDAEARQRLLDILSRESDVLRIAAAKALASWADLTLIDELEAFREDDNLDVARAITKTIEILWENED